MKSMYKILIVDDESWVRKGIISKLQGNRIDFAWIGEASNGEEALEVITKEHPHIVIADIRMPFMDGIELIRRVRENHLDIRFVIVSGYAEFEYAEQALNMGVSGYILKPICDENLVKTMRKVVADLDQVTEIKNIRNKNEILKESNELLNFERMANQIFHTPDEPVMELCSKLKELWGGNIFTLILIHIDSSNYYRSEFEYNDLELLKFAIKNILGDMGVNDSILVMDNYKDITQVMVLVKSHKEAPLRIFCDRFALDTYMNITKHLKVCVTIAISGIKDGITAELLKQARIAYQQCLVYGGNRIYKYENLEIKQKMNFPEHKLKLLQNCLEFNDVKNIHIILKDIFSVDLIKDLPWMLIRFIYSEVINMLIRICSQRQIDITSSLDEDMITGKIIERFDNTNDIANYLYTTIIDLIKAETAVAHDCKDLIISIKNYICQNYEDELMVKDIAQKFALNPNYLSTIYRQETGITITKYIEDIRIEKACKLLLGTRNNISDIARGVGYVDTQYFYRVFKKVVGVTPMEYRNQKTEKIREI